MTGSTGLGETLGGLPTKAIIDGDVAPMFLDEDPFHTEAILAKTLFVPFDYGKAGLCAIAALEMACWDLKAKAINRPLCDLLGGRLRDEVPFASYIFYRHDDHEWPGPRFKCRRGGELHGRPTRQVRLPGDQVQRRRSSARAGSGSSAGAAFWLPYQEAALRSQRHPVCGDLDSHSAS